VSWTETLCPSLRDAMTPRTLLALALLLPFGSLLPTSPPRAAAAAEAEIEDLGFLEGRWVGGDGHSEWETVYTSPHGGEVLSASKEVRGDRVVTHDFERFHVSAGKLTMTPFPGGRQSHDFPLVELTSGRKAVFENPENDFPSRFTYHRVDDGHLRIRLEGDTGGEPLVVELDLEKQ